MKARVITVVLIILLIILHMASCSDVKYPSGRDTVESYGDGTFQIVGRNPSSVIFAVFIQEFSSFPEDVQEIFGKMTNGELGNKMD